MSRIILPALAASVIILSGCGSGDAQSGGTASGNPVVSPAQAADNIAKINAAWAKCGIPFQIEEYVAVDPSEHGLSLNTANQAELDQIRAALRSDGAILESEVGGFPLIIAHEIGHYLNLGHVSDTSDLMNPVIYDTSSKLDAGQCAEARAAIDRFWGAMKR